MKQMRWESGCVSSDLLCVFLGTDDDKGIRVITTAISIFTTIHHHSLSLHGYNQMTRLGTSARLIWP